MERKGMKRIDSDPLLVWFFMMESWEKDHPFSG